MVDQVKTTEEFDAVLKDNKSVFVDFFATWCGPCEKVSEEVSGVKFIKVDVDDLGDVASRYGIASIPALFAFKNGEKVGEIVGFVPAPQVKALAEKTL